MVMAMVMGMVVGCANERPTELPVVVEEGAAPGASAPAESVAAEPAAPPWIGVIRAAAAVDVTAPHPGQLMVLDVRPGDRVEAGQVLATLRDPEAEDELAATEAALRSSRAEVEQARVELDAAKHELAVAERLHGSGVGRRADVEAARFERRRTEAALARTRAAAAERRVRCDQLRRHVDELTIRASHEGQVAQRYYDPGARVLRDAPVVRLIHDDARWVRFAVARDPMPTIGSRVRVSLDDGTILAAEVRHVAPEVDAVAGMMFVDARIETAQPLDPGTSAWVRAGT